MLTNTPRPSLFLGALLGGLTTLPLMALSYLAEQFSASAKRMEQLQGMLIVVAGGAVVGLIVALATRRSNWPGRNVGGVAGLVVFLFVAAVETRLGHFGTGNAVIALLWLLVLIAGWGALLGNWLADKRLSKASPTLIIHGLSRCQI
jgi:hypothetical protein